LHGEERIYGHQNGVSAVRAASEACAELGVKYLTLYAFSTENWARPQEEVNALMELLVETIRNEMSTLMENKIRLEAIGDTGSLPQKCYGELQEAIRETENNTGLVLILALNYSSRWELTEAMKKIGNEIRMNKLNPSEITEKTIPAYLNTRDIPDPELMIRHQWANSGLSKLFNCGKLRLCRAIFLHRWPLA
jgi:undecaprenyl diphosphate synthase